MKVILNEKKLVEKALKEKYISDKPTDVIKALIKHYYICGMDYQQVRQAIEKFMEESFSFNKRSYNPIKWKDTLDGLTKSLGEGECTLNNVECINITKDELEIIKSLKDNKVEKIAFVALVHAKIYNQLNKNNDNWVNSSSNDLFRDAKLPFKTIRRKKRELIIGELLDKGLLGEAKNNSNANIKVNFINEESEVVIKITDFNDYIYEFMKWKGEKIGKCERCPANIILTNNRIKYCSNCAKKIKNEQNALYRSKKINCEENRKA